MQEFLDYIKGQEFLGYLAIYLFGSTWLIFMDTICTGINYLLKDEIPVYKTPSDLKVITSLFCVLWLILLFVYIVFLFKSDKLYFSIPLLSLTVLLPIVMLIFVTPTFQDNWVKKIGEHWSSVKKGSEFERKNKCIGWDNYTQALSTYEFGMYNGCKTIVEPFIKNHCNELMVGSIVSLVLSVLAVALYCYLLFGLKVEKFFTIPIELLIALGR